ncbi:class I SAM-dependent methyltransferase [Actinokineospora cianjurensis]|uniref:Ubiquinone/menaquinone biosynthesis C-methylase UbiE n=1 Tax=Actinokineospora cianjurensis TaxID=585224 RepID=A0A421B1L2_9PSEU|nr:class I SAM-dependent methyltransferase [Actinokineospora cianjurensis]RLK58218.1 ubiquinone/menaquinone biosynthesis C-methylase UbiE [Actinokineospora cianjurensis]
MDLVRHYTTHAEGDRLTRTPHGRLEFLRTQELLRRVLTTPARVLDVGGATGAHAEWLARDGHAVHVVDIVPAHVDAAAELPGVTAHIGDARALPAEDDSVDAVLLFGPLYHLLTPADRAQSLTEARRVLRPGGLLAASAISRYLSLLETAANGTLDAALAPPIDAVITSGHYDGHIGFTATHWHTADELRTELESATFENVEVYGIEGPSWPALDTAGDAGFAARIDAALRCARLVEQDPLLINTSAHLLALAHT